MHASDYYFCAFLMFKHPMIGAFFSVGWVLIGRVAVAGRWELSFYGYTRILCWVVFSRRGGLGFYNAYIRVFILSSKDATLLLVLPSFI
jgi:hypothetical protein